jgi:hypothetical protein
MNVKQRQIRENARSLARAIEVYSKDKALSLYAACNAVNELTWAYHNTPRVPRKTLLEIYTKTLHGLAAKWCFYELSESESRSLWNNIYFYLGVIYAWLPVKIGEN